MQWDSEYHIAVITVPPYDVSKFSHRGRFLYLDKRQHPEFSVLVAPRTGGGRELP